MDDAEKLWIAIEKKEKKTALKLCEARELQLALSLDATEVPLLLPEIESLLLERGLLKTQDPPTGSSRLQELDVPFLRPSLSEALWIEVPSYIHSSETYECLGFTRNIASTLFGIYQSSRQMLLPLSDHFVNIAKRRIYDGEQADRHTHRDCNQYLLGLGIAEALRATILHEQFRDIMSTASCNAWVHVAIDSRWAEFHQLNKNIILALTAASTEGDTETPKHSNTEVNTVPKHEGMETDYTCSGTTKSGEACRARVKNQGSFCHHHLSIDC